MYPSSCPSVEDHYIMIAIQYMIIIVFKGSRRGRRELWLSNMMCSQGVPLSSFIYATELEFTRVILEYSFLYSKAL
jgi:hypothetical protein